MPAEAAVSRAAAWAYAVPTDPPGAWRAMQRAVRNLGRAGLCATAVSAVDVALWNPKAKLLRVLLATLLGRHRDAVPIYGSGGFTSCDGATLARQLGAWVERDGCRCVRTKIGTEPDRDPARVRAVKHAIGSAALFVDANGALAVKQARHLSRVFSAEADVRWFEEPVSLKDGQIAPDWQQPGLGLVFRQHDAGRFAMGAG